MSDIPAILLLWLLQLLLLLASAPLISGIIGKTKARFQHRRGAGILQPYSDLAKLLRKDVVISPVASRGARHVDVTRSELADFVVGKGAPAKGGGPLAELDRVLDRSRLMPLTTPIPAVLDAKGDLKYNDGLEH